MYDELTAIKRKYATGGTVEGEGYNAQHLEREPLLSYNSQHLEREPLLSYNAQHTEPETVLERPEPILDELDGTKEFPEAFREARRRGLLTFMWRGRKFNTKLKKASGGMVGPPMGGRGSTLMDRPTPFPPPGFERGKLTTGGGAPVMPGAGGPQVASGVVPMNPGAGAPQANVGALAALGQDLLKERQTVAGQYGMMPPSAPAVTQPFNPPSMPGSPLEALNAPQASAPSVTAVGTPEGDAGAAAEPAGPGEWGKNVWLEGQGSAMSREQLDKAGPDDPVATGPTVVMEMFKKMPFNLRKLLMQKYGRQ